MTTTVAVPQAQSLLMCWAYRALALFGALFLSCILSASIDRDCTSYWAAGHQLVHGLNPYDPSAVMSLERAAGYRQNRPGMMRNFPLTLWLVAPLGFLSWHAAAILWTTAVIFAIGASIKILWRLHGSPPTLFHLAGYLFAPVLATLFTGQSSAFVLLGLCGFLYSERRRPAMAGAYLALCVIKPHILMPVLVVYSISGFRRRNWRGLSAFFGSTVAMAAVGFLLRPTAWAEYGSMMGGENMAVPTISTLLRLAIHPQWGWIQFVPVAGACILATLRSDTSDWDELLIISLLCSPYSWLNDEVIMLPLVFRFLYREIENRTHMMAYAIVSGAALGEFVYGVKMFSPFYLWTPIAWTGLYLMSRQPINVNDPPPEDAAAMTIVNA